MYRPLGVAIAGLGFGEKVHLPALHACPGTEPVALWHPRQERLDQACQQSGLRGHQSFEALLAEPSVEAVVIATPPEPRFKLARQSLLAGKHVLLEKPVTLRAEQAEELQRLALEAGLTVAVDFEYRAVPLFQQLHELLHKGAIGEPVLMKLDWLMGSRADASRPWNWYSQVSQGGGVLGALGTHAFDMVHWLLGPGRTMRAQLSTAIHERPRPDRPGEMAPVDAEDIALIQMEVDGPAGTPVPVQINLSSVTRRGRGCWLEVYGRKGTIVLGSENQSDYVHGFNLWISLAGEPLRRLEPDPRWAFTRTWEDGRIAPVERIHQWWSDAVRQRRPMIPGIAEGVASQHCCDQARE
jgi:predicted dehydrogenase